MRHQLLISTALATLIASTSLGMAQDRPQDKNAAAIQGAAPAPQNAPAEKNGAASTQSNSRMQNQAQQPASRTDVTVNLTNDERTRIRNAVVKQPNAPRVAHVDFALNVGAVVPSRVHVIALPPQIVEIHPAWRGYMYFMVGDEIVIVEPGTLRIVEILPA